MKTRQSCIATNVGIISVSLLFLALGYYSEYYPLVAGIVEAAIGSIVDPIPWLAAAGVAFWIRDKQYRLFYAVVLGVILAIGMHFAAKAIYSTWLRIDHAVELALGRFLIFMFVVLVVDIFLQRKATPEAR